MQQYSQAKYLDLFENLSDNQIEAVKTIDEDLEIIACAGAGKTGVVTRRIINILKSNPDILPDFLTCSFLRFITPNSPFFLKISYKPLWKLLIDREMTKTELRKRTQIAPSTFTKMNNDQQVSLDILARICLELKCGFDDVVQIESVKRDS